MVLDAPWEVFAPRACERILRALGLDRADEVATRLVVGEDLTSRLRELARIIHGSTQPEVDADRVHFGPFRTNSARRNALREVVAGFCRGDALDHLQVRE